MARRCVTCVQRCIFSCGCKAEVVTMQAFQLQLAFPSPSKSAFVFIQNFSSCSPNISLIHYMQQTFYICYSLKNAINTIQQAHKNKPVIKRMSQLYGTKELQTAKSFLYVLDRIKMMVAWSNHVTVHIKEGILILLQ